ncbi:MAG TPA: hypothetical protein VGQ00_04200 [Candidatus Norongarragalinales archaeon]|jgi:succinate dehydrogenase hydrophobic anchor subunit|nr:hypothetical protein [Candidatus Norongarragalinales archaeon]
MTDVSKNTLVALAGVLLVVTVMATVFALDNITSSTPAQIMSHSETAQASFQVIAPQTPSTTTVHSRVGFNVVS